MHNFESAITEIDLAQDSFEQKSIENLELGDTPKDKIYWIHCNYNDQKFFQQIAEKLRLSEKIIELIHQKDFMPGYFDNVASLTLRLQCLSTRSVNTQSLKFSNLIIHLTEKYCLTIASAPIRALTSFNENYHKALQFAKTPGFILFLLVDELINDYANILFKFEFVYDHIDVHKNALESNLYAKVMSKKKQLINVKRHAIAMRGILMRISGRKIKVISEECRLSLAELLEHVQLIISEATSIQDMLHGTLDQIDNNLMHTLNETMRILTAFSAIFLPLNLVTGIYGMNFYWMPELAWKYGYFFSLFLMIFIAIILFVVFKLKKMF